MIEQWVLEKLKPLRHERLIILRDPQRMIRRGAQAVDGWATENGFTVLFVSGNLGLRDQFEQIRDDASVKIILLDRTREKARLPLFYPDIETQCSSRAKLKITLQQYLQDTTGDDRWPLLVNDRNISRLLMENVEGSERSHRQLRDVDSHRFSDSDLYKIALGSALEVNPFRKLSPKEIRHLCIVRHDRLQEIERLFSASGTDEANKVLDELHRQVSKADKPWRWMLEHDPQEVVRAFTLAAILHQHDLEYQVLLANVDPGLASYSDIPKKVIRQTLKDMLAADADQMAKDVAEVEKFLTDDPKRVEFLLADRLVIDDASNAKKVLLAEKLSPLLRGMCLVSLVADLLVTKNLPFHRAVLQTLDDEGEAGTKELPLAARRPTTQWNNLLAAYRRAIDVFEIAAKLHDYARKLKVCKGEQLEFSWFYDLWTKDRIDRLEYYGTELSRLLRVGDLLPIPQAQFWGGLSERWEKAKASLNEALTTSEKNLHTCDTRFQDLYHAHYVDWINGKNSPIIFTHQFVPNFLKAHWDTESGKKAVLLIFDGLRTDAWEELVKPVLEEKFDLQDSYPGSAILPTETHLSRKAISAGCLPVEFSSTTENKLLEYALKKHLGLEVKFKVEKDAEDAESGISTRYLSDKIDVVIFNFTDKNLHNSKLSLSQVYRSVVRDTVQQDVRAVLREMPDDAVIFVTSDHGFCPVSDHNFKVPHDRVTDNKDVKYRVGRLKYPLEGNDAKEGICFKVENLGIPDKIKGSTGGEWAFMHIMFPRPGRTLQRPNVKQQNSTDRYTHGGLSMAECLIPLHVLGQKVEFEPAFELIGLDFEGATIEGETLAIVVTAYATDPVQDKLLIQLHADLDEVEPRKEVFVGSEQVYRINWRPNTDSLTDDERKAGKLVRDVTVVASYRLHDRPVRTSAHGRVEIKLDTTRIRRRLDSRLDSIMGMVPKGLRE